MKKPVSREELAVGIDSAQPNPEPSKRRWLTCLARAINISAMGRGLVIDERSTR